SMLPDGPARLSNLDKLRALVRRLESESRSPSHAVQLLTDLEYDDGEAELSRLDPDSDAVRITTIFKAKGLESPIVVLLDMTRDIRGSRTAVHRAERQISIKVGKYFQPPDWKTTKQDEDAALLEERRRWMYVACTRARDQLVIVCPNTDLSRSLLLPIDSGWKRPAGEHDSIQDVADGVTVRVRRGPQLPEVPSGDEAFPGRDADVSKLIAVQDHPVDPADDVRATTLHDALMAARRACPRWKSVGQIAAEVSKGEISGTGVGARGGTVVHRTMEELDLTADATTLADEAPALARIIAAELGLPDDLTERCVTVVRRLIAHDILNDLRAAREHHKELPFAFQDRGRTIAGTIDLCFPEDEARAHWVVVDWKSDTPAEGSDMRKGYEKQLETYSAAMLKTITPCKHVRTVLVGPYAELPEESPEPYLLESLPDDLREVVATLLANGAPLPRTGVHPDTGATLALWWPEQQIAVADEADAESAMALANAGWQVLPIAEAGRLIGLLEQPDDTVSDDPDFESE
ncbi:MAG: 3'-5' exonuclease, partial [Planctomycetota bacterium]